MIKIEVLLSFPFALSHFVVQGRPQIIWSCDSFSADISLGKLRKRTSKSKIFW